MKLPMLVWVRSYDRSYLRGDLIAGVTVAALIVPKNLGYAGIAGIPLQNGLYAAAAGAILYAIFGTSRQISMGPSSGLAAVAASAVLAAGLTAEQDIATFVARITLASGVLFLLLAVLRMGWIAQFLSRAVVTGFLFGAAIDVVIGELPKLTGTDTTGSNSFQELRSWLTTWDERQQTTVLVGAAALLVVFGLRRVAPRVPGALVLVVGGLAASWASITVPDGSLMWDNAATMATAAVALVLIGFSQTAGDARAFAAKHDYQIDLNQESVAQSATNIGAGLFQGMPVSTSLSASSLNDHAGARTGLASLTSGVTVLLTLLILAPLFADLPKPVLAALIIEAVVMGMMNVPEMRRLFRVQPFDFWIAILAIVATLAFGVLAGVVIGIALSLVWLIYVATQPAMPLLGRQSGTQVFRDLAEHPDDEQFPGVPSGSTGACSSPAPMPSRTACAPWSSPHRSSSASCSTAKGSTSSTRRERPPSATSSCSATRQASSCGWPASSPPYERCWTGTASSSCWAPTTSTATCTAPSRHSSVSRRDPGAPPRAWASSRS